MARAWVLVMALLGASPAMAATVDCGAVKNIDGNTSYKIQTTDAKQCMLRGFDPATSLKPDGGKSSGIKSAGQGYHYGGMNAPDRPPGKTTGTASISSGAMNASCNFPPTKATDIFDASFVGGLTSLKATDLLNSNITSKLTPSFKAGSCYKFLQNQLSDNSNGNAAGSIPISDGGLCPEDTDSTGLFGVKRSVSNGGTALRPCGGMLPVTTYDLVMNRNPDYILSTENGGYAMWVYRRSTTIFPRIINGSNANSTSHEGRLPRCLAEQHIETVGDGDQKIYWVKTVDLTPPVAQMITYTASHTTINIRLQPRESMRADFIPAYDDSAPVFDLVLPIDPTTGKPEVPQEFITTSGESCASDTSGVWRVPVNNQEITLHSATSAGCEGPPTLPTCSSWAQRDTTGSEAGCNDPAAPSTADFVAASLPTSLASVDVASTCPAGTTSAAPDASCDVVTIYPKGTFADTVCDGKKQYAVLNRPNLYYPPNTTSTLYKMTGRTALMATVVDGSTLFMQSNATISLSPTAPAVKLNEGGFIKMKDGSILIASPPAVVNPSTFTVVMEQGGQLVSSGGSQIQGFDPGATFVIPTALQLSPIQIRVGRSIILPAGYMIPTMPVMASDPLAPYMRLPADKPPS
ncbi:MAG: hypothetical protein V4735_01115 [Pseudomonadota bacterium]